MKFAHIKHAHIFFGSLALLVLVLVLMDTNIAHAALVTCGNGDGGKIEDSCKFGDFFNTAIAFIDYMLAGAAVAAVGGVVWGGALMVTSAGNQSKVETGKKSVKNSVIGLSIILVAFLLVRSVFTILGFQGGDAPLSNPGGFTDPNSGFQLINPGENSGGTNPTPAPSGTTGTVPAPSGSSQELAQKILQTLGAGCFRDSHISGLGVGDGATARDNIVDVAAGRAAKRSSYGSTTIGGSTTLDPRMLQAMLAIYGAGYSSICPITAIAGSAHNTRASAHYSGKAFDIDQTLNAASILAICKQYGATGAINEGNHLHCEW